MRQLIGKIPTKEPNVIEEVYFAELIRCRECQKSVPMGIEVVRVKRDGKSKKVLSHRYYCRAHGESWPYQSLPIRPRTRE